MAKYGRNAQKTVGRVMHEYKHHQLRHAKSREQAVAIGLSEARRSGEKVPPPPKRKTKRKK